MLSSCSDDITAPDSWPEWPERATVSVNDKELTETYYGSFSGTSITLTEGQTVNFSGFEHLRYALQGHFWTVTSDSEAVFKGATGEYDFIFDSANGVAYVEQPAKSIRMHYTLLVPSWAIREPAAQSQQLGLLTRLTMRRLYEK